MYATDQYKTNLSQVIRGLRKELRRPGEDLLPFVELARRINEAIAPYLDDGGAINPQSLQQWSPSEVKQRKMKYPISGVNAQRMGVYLGCPSEVAADWFQRWLKERPTGEFEGQSVAEEFRQFIESRPSAGRVALDKPAQYRAEEYSPTQVMQRLREISAEIRQLVATLDRLLAQTPPNLQELLWRELKRAKQQGKLVANIDNPRAVAREFSKCCLNYDPDRLYKILSGSLVEIDLDLCELDLFAHGLSVLLDEQWERQTLQELLKGNASAQPTQKPQQFDARESETSRA